MDKNIIFAYSCLAQLICFIIVGIVASSVGEQMFLIGWVLIFASIIQVAGLLCTAICWAKEALDI